ncbi:MAG: sigma-54-dependent Fis family transcriptional regulator [Deltaproteobacteria bacterium]|nr:sigma-54-dependent Fis family transcriptional regulator [Deltaproteobacteria bacterium]
MDKKLGIMVVDDEQIVRESLYHWFRKSGHAVDMACSGFEALEKLEERPFDVLFVDVKMPGMSGLELLGAVKERYPDTTIVIITAYGSIPSAVEAMKLGASDYLLKPFRADQMELLLEKIEGERKLRDRNRYVEGLLEKMTRFDNIIGRSAPMQKLFSLIPEVAQSDASVLITGETGVGKELVAKAIHAKSRRSRGPFIAINCGAMPDTLLESELFGHDKGAFTGAHQSRKGFLEVVSGGTLFLDEIGEISLKMQIDLLRVLEERKIIRVGEREPIEVDFRLISSTCRDPEEQVKSGHFREDFFYRINVVTLCIPPLRERRDDIPLLVQHFLQKYSNETAKRVDALSREAVDLLQEHTWPGNVRELENAIERAVVLSKSRTLRAEDFLFLRPHADPSTGSGKLRSVEREHIFKTLQQQDWNISRSAVVLGISRATLYKMIQRHDLKPPR